MLVANFFNQTQLKPDPTVLPIIHAGAVHIAAASQRSALEGFSPVITGSLSDGQKDPGMSETFFSSDAYGVLIGAAKNYETRGTPPDEAAPFILVSDSHWATYKQLLPSADDLKLRGITRVVVGLENEDKGIRSLDEMLELGQPGQKILASRLKSYQDEGIVVELHGLDESRGEHPTTLPRRIMWESGDLLSLEQLRALQPEATNALFDRYRMKFQDAGSSFGAQRDRIEKARQEALEGRW